jgi:hypothetical protein
LHEKCAEFRQFDRALDHADDIIHDAQKVLLKEIWLECSFAWLRRIHVRGDNSLLCTQSR